MGAHLEAEVWSRWVLAQRHHALTFKARKYFATHSYLKDNLTLKSPARKIIVLKIIWSFYVTVFRSWMVPDYRVAPCRMKLTPLGVPHLTASQLFLSSSGRELESQRSQTLEMWWRRAPFHQWEWGWWHLGRTSDGPLQLLPLCCPLGYMVTLWAVPHLPFVSLLY